MKKSTKWILRLLLTFGGAAAGFFLSVTAGCGGQCMIMGTPWISSVYVGVIGLLLSYVLIPDKKEP